MAQATSICLRRITMMMEKQVAVEAVLFCSVQCNIFDTFLAKDDIPELFTASDP